MLLSKLASPFWMQSRRLPYRGANLVAKQPIRHGSGKRVLYIFRNKHHATQYGKLILWYTAIGLIPAALLIFYTSYIIGEAELYDYDPEQYQPEFHEFFAHPITRFLSKYCVEDPRISYYKDIYALESESQYYRMTRLTRAVREIERHMGFRGWTRWDGPIRDEYTVDALDKYVKEHEIGVEVKR